MDNYSLGGRDSLCGSMGGDTFASRRRKNTCTLRNHSIDILAKSLREHKFELDSKPKDEPKRKRINTSFHQLRFVVVMLGGIALGLMLLLRYNVTVAILNMVNQTAIYMEEHPNKTMEDFYAEGYSSTGEFDWDNEIQHMIMSWYMIAYTIPQMPCTKIGLMIGSRRAIPISLLICAISTLLVPPFAYFGWQWVIALRLINGIGASAVLPVMLNLIENWMPFNEITLGLTFAQLLQSTLTAVNPLFAGYLSAIHWSYAFYWPAIITIVFCVIFLIVVTDNPDENWLISEKEVGTICCCELDHAHSNCSNKQQNSAKVRDEAKTENDAEKVEEEEEKISWLDIFKVPAFYAYTVMWCFYCSPYSVFVFILPTYLRQFLKINVAQTGVYCGLIQTGCIVSVLWPHKFLRILQENFKLSLTASRRVTNLIITSMVAFTWAFTGAFHSSQLLMFFLNRCFHGSNDINVTGNLMANFSKSGMSSIVFSMVNTVGNMSVVFFSTSVGYVLDLTGQSDAGWSYIYYGLAGTQLIFLIVFSTFIDSNPIEFKRKTPKCEIDEKTERTQAADELNSVQVVAEGDAKQNKPKLLNNFDKMRTNGNGEDS